MLLMVNNGYNSLRRLYKEHFFTLYELEYSKKQVLYNNSSKLRQKI